MEFVTNFVVGFVLIITALSPCFLMCYDGWRENKKAEAALKRKVEVTLRMWDREFGKE